MATKKETNASVEAEARANERSAELVRRDTARAFREQEKVFVRIPPLYKPYFGKTLPIVIQGITVAIPVDGKSYKVPKVYADRAQVLMSNQDDMIEKGEKAANYKDNFERSPGELSLF